MTTPPPPTARLAGLDGLRALAVILVLVYHLFPSSPLRSGFVGVDVFFVISGFLITSLLLSRRTRGLPRLLDFWRRRARRLLPALAVVITVCASLAAAIGGDVLVGMGRQVLGAATFSYNWLAIAAGEDYFTATAPELFRNVWSLAVEEQFYVLWPLLLPLVLLIPGRAVRVVLMIVLAGGSAWWMAQLAAADQVTRAYFGTDAHAFGLLLGIALALTFGSGSIPEREWMRGVAPRILTGLLGAAGIAAIFVAATLPETFDSATFPGSLLLASLGTLLALLGSVWPGSLLGRVLDLAPLRWIGDRSYGIYLWHWPVLVLALAVTRSTGPDGGVPPLAGVVALILSVTAAALSYRFIEQPVRRRGFRTVLRGLGRRITGSPRTRFTGLALIATATLAIGGTTIAVASAPDRSSATSMIEAGIEAMENGARGPAGQRHDGTATPTPSGSASPKPEKTGGTGPVIGGDEPIVETAPPPGSGVPVAPGTNSGGTADQGPPPVSGDEITAIGDSVMLASAPSLYEKLPGITVDAAVSRSIWAGPGLLDAIRSSGQLRKYVVVALGTNGPVDEGMLSDLAEITGPERNLILVNAYAPRDWIPGVNADLATFADAHRRVWIADWSAAIEPQTDLLAGDRIHPGKAGGDVFAETIIVTIQNIKEERARAEEVRHAFDRIPAKTPED